jgi:hypothetical protein
MAEVSMSHEQLQKILETITRMTPLEQRKYDEEVAKERRRDLLAVQLSKAEEASARAKRENCSHMRFPPTAGKNAGQLAPKGTAGAEWCTGGQAYQNGLAMIFCSRCHSDWWFKPTQEFYVYIQQNGLDGTPPPDDAHSVCIGCYEDKPNCKCSEIAKENAAAHPTVAVA